MTYKMKGSAFYGKSPFKQKKTIQLSTNEEAERKVIKKRTDAVENARKQAEAAIAAHEKAISQYEHPTDSVNTVGINERAKQLEAELAEINKKKKKKK